MKGGVSVGRGYLPPVVYEAWTAEQVDKHLDNLDRRRKELAAEPTPQAAKEYAHLDEAIDKLLELRLEITGRACAAGTRVDRGRHAAD